MNMNMDGMNMNNMYDMNNMNMMNMNDMQNNQIETQIQQNMPNQGKMINMNNFHQINLNNENQKYIQNLLSIKERIREEPTTITHIKTCEEDDINNCIAYLFRFFKLILIDQEKAHTLSDSLGKETILINKNKTKLYVNYYNIIKAEVYIDINLKVKEINTQIFVQIFYPYLIKNHYKRTNKNQTTESVILNPLKDINYKIIPFNYENFLYLEFKGNDLSKNKEITGKTLGLEDYDELSLKIEPEILNEIKEFPKSKGHILIRIKNNLFGTFYPSEKGITHEKFDKIFNFYSYRCINSHINDKEKNIYENYNFILKNDGIRGAGIYDGFPFVDPSNSSIKQLNLSKNAPKWRIISEGLNIFGKCLNKDCQAYKKEVIYKTNLNIELREEGIIFNIIESADKIRCPICYKIFEPNTCGFYKCEYQFIGEKKENGDKIHYDTKTREANGNTVEYYEPKKGKGAKWFKLKIYVLPIQEIKYKPN